MNILAKCRKTMSFSQVQTVWKKVRICRASVMRSFLVFLVIFCVFCLHEVYEWGIWNAYLYQQYSGCSEIVNNYKNPGYSVHDDLELRQECKTKAVIQMNKKLELVRKEYNSTLKVSIFSKCGTVHPILVSSKAPKEGYKKIFAERYSHSGGTKYQVPNIVHYVMFGINKFHFLNYLSFRSVYKFINPAAIYIHGDALPYGDWWDRTVKEIPGIYHVSRSQPIRIQGRNVRWVEHSSDIMRLQTLYDNGGIYLDTDIIVLKSFNNLRRFELTLGRESSYGLGSGIILSAPYSAFLCIWKEAYRNYRPFPWNWATYAVWLPSKLAKILPDWIHIEEDTLQKPSWNEPELLFNKVVKWSDSYAIHVWKRFGEVPEGLDDIKELNTTLGEVMRYVYYGSSKLVSEGHPKAKERSHTRWNFNVAVDLIGTKILSRLGFNT